MFATTNKTETYFILVLVLAGLWFASLLPWVIVKVLGRNGVRIVFQWVIYISCILIAIYGVYLLTGRRTGEELTGAVLLVGSLIAISIQSHQVIPSNSKPDELEDGTN